MCCVGCFYLCTKKKRNKKICEETDASSRAEADVARQVCLVVYWLVVLPTESRSWYNLVRLTL